MWVAANGEAGNDKQKQKDYFQTYNKCITMFSFDTLFPDAMELFSSFMFLSFFRATFISHIWGGIIFAQVWEFVQRLFFFIRSQVKKKDTHPLV